MSNRLQGLSEIHAAANSASEIHAAANLASEMHAVSEQVNERNACPAIAKESTREMQAPNAEKRHAFRSLSFKLANEMHAASN